jgi:hypothetical protein
LVPGALLVFVRPFDLGCIATVFVDEHALDTAAKHMGYYGVRGHMIGRDLARDPRISRSTASA